MPGPHQWEATFTRTNRRFTAKANETTSTSQGFYAAYQSQPPKTNQLIKIFLTKLEYFFSDLPSGLSFLS